MRLSSCVCQVANVEVLGQLWGEAKIEDTKGPVVKARAREREEERETQREGGRGREGERRGWGKGLG